MSSRLHWVLKGLSRSDYRRLADKLNITSKDLNIWESEKVENAKRGGKN